MRAHMIRCYIIKHIYVFHALFLWAVFFPLYAMQSATYFNKELCCAVIINYLAQ